MTLIRGIIIASSFLLYPCSNLLAENFSPEAVRLKMLNVKQDDFIRGFIVHCIYNRNKIQRIEDIAKISDWIEVDEEISDIMVSSDKDVFFSKYWFMENGEGGPAFVGIQKSDRKGITFESCVFSNTRIEDNDLIEKLYEYIPELQNVAGGKNISSNQSVMAFNDGYHPYNFIVRFSKSSFDQFGGAQLQLFWPVIE